MEGRGNGVDWEMLGGDPNRRRLEEDPANWVYSTYGVNSFTSTVHCAGPGLKDDFDMVKRTRPPASLADDDGFLVFGLRWSEGRVRTYYVDSATGEEHTVVDWRGHDRRPNCRGAYDDAKTPLAPYSVLWRWRFSRDVDREDEETSLPTCSVGALRRRLLRHLQPGRRRRLRRQGLLLGPRHALGPGELPGQGGGPHERRVLPRGAGRLVPDVGRRRPAPRGLDPRLGAPGRRGAVKEATRAGQAGARGAGSGGRERRRRGARRGA
jgi:hypothetical protein